MKSTSLLLGVGIASLACGVSAPLANDAAAVSALDPSALHSEIAALDTSAFEAFNNCSLPGELQRHASYFAPDVEFYHDTGGVTWNQQDMLANTEKYVCGKFKRELVPDTLKVFPIKDFGAIEQGVHRFCQLDTGKCEGMADFIIVWRYKDKQWLITRVLSYGHRGNSG